MPFVWKAPKLSIAGNADESVSPYVKAWIKRGSECVVGLIGEGSSLELQANWDSPFEQDNPGSFFEKAGGLLQHFSEQTSKTTLNSAQVWNGNRPLTINLTINLYALSDPKTEVEDALSSLKKFASPEVNNDFPVDGVLSGNIKIGRIPSSVTLNVGRNFIYNNCIIESVSEPFDVTKDKNGHRLRATCNVSIQTDKMLNESDIDGLSN